MESDNKSFGNMSFYSHLKLRIAKHQVSRFEVLIIITVPFTFQTIPLIFRNSFLISTVLQRRDDITVTFRLVEQIDDITLRKSVEKNMIINEHPLSQSGISDRQKTSKITSMHSVDLSTVINLIAR